MVVFRVFAKPFFYWVIMYILKFLQVNRSRPQCLAARISFPKLILPVFVVNPESFQENRIIFLQKKFYLLSSESQKITLYIIRPVIRVYFPDQVDMIGHQNKGVHADTFFLHQKPEAADYYFFMGIIF